jgi:predicted TIM-barrel fold metal-dependent hydrolase
MAMTAADCHAHVFCGNAIPYAAERVYTPHPSQMGTAKQFAAVLESHGISHGLLVGAGVYGTDNSCLLDAIASSRGMFKGIALVKPGSTERDLAALADRGVVGLRINLMNNGLRELTEPGADKLLAQAKEMNWFVQVHYQKDELVPAVPILRKAGVRLMFDHFGRPDVARGVNSPGFQALLEFGREGKSIIKLSGPFRASVDGAPYHDVDPFIAAAIKSYTLEHCVWGSDWPWVRMDERVDYGPVLNCVSRWLPDPRDMDKVLKQNPAKLFGFK